MGVLEFSLKNTQAGCRFLSGGCQRKCAISAGALVDTLSHDTHCAKITVHYPFHPHRGQELEVVSASRHNDGSVTVVGPDGGLRMPKWMVAATAARFCVSPQATLSCSALLLLADLVSPGGRDDDTRSSPSAATLKAGASDPGKGGGHGATAATRARGGREREGAHDVARGGSTGLGGPHGGRHPSGARAPRRRPR